MSSAAKPLMKSVSPASTPGRVGQRLVAGPARVDRRQRQPRRGDVERDEHAGAVQPRHQDAAGAREDARAAEPVLPLAVRAPVDVAGLGGAVVERRDRVRRATARAPRSRRSASSRHQAYWPTKSPSCTTSPLASTGMHRRQHDRPGADRRGVVLDAVVRAAGQRLDHDRRDRAARCGARRTARSAATVMYSVLIGSPWGARRSASGDQGGQVERVHGGGQLGRGGGAADVARRAWRRARRRRCGRRGRSSVRPSASATVDPARARRRRPAASGTSVTRTRVGEGGDVGAAERRRVVGVDGDLAVGEQRGQAPRAARTSRRTPCAARPCRACRRSRRCRGAPRR